MSNYRILCNDRVIYSNLSEEEMFEVMDDLSQQFYETGTPHPSDIMVEYISSKEI